MISSGPVAPLNRDPPNTEEAALRRMFTLIDVDKSGKVSKNELSTAVHNEETLQKFLDRVPVLHVLVKENNFEMHFMREFEDVDQISWQQFLQFFREEKVKRTQFGKSAPTTRHSYCRSLDHFSRAMSYVAVVDAPALSSRSSNGYFLVCSLALTNYPRVHLLPFFVLSVQHGKSKRDEQMSLIGSF